MNWTAIGVVVAISIALWGGFIAYLRAAVKSSVQEMQGELSDELKELVREFREDFLHKPVWEQFYRGEFKDLRDRVEGLHRRR